jgi:hypothetical protein
MKKVALALLVLAIAMPAVADVTITLTNDANVVTIGYDCNDGEVVRAFALNVDVNNGGFIEGSVEPNTADYWVYPTNMTFTVVDGNTVVAQYGSPIAGESNAGGVLEMASLYGENDPNRQDAPPSSGDLCSFAVDVNCTGVVAVDVTLNGQRGGVVLEDPGEGVVVNLPDQLEVPCGDDCLKVGEYCGGVLIEQYMYDNWVSIGKPDAWCHPAHFAGDADMNCSINAVDLVGGGGAANFKAAFLSTCGGANYEPSCDTDNNCAINAVDLVGGGAATCLPNGCGVKPNFLRVIDGYPPECP